MRTRVLIAAMLVLMVLGGLAPAAAAQTSDVPKNCWGVVSGQRAQTGGLGDHASQQSTPRAGLGNLSRTLGFDHISELGSFLAEVDDIPDTECP